MNDGKSFGGQKSGSFLHRIIPKNYFDIHKASSLLAAGIAPQKFFTFTLIHIAIRKNYFQFIKFSYLKGFKWFLVYRLFSRECFLCFSGIDLAANELFISMKIKIAGQ